MPTGRQGHEYEGVQRIERESPDTSAGPLNGPEEEGESGKLENQKHRLDRVRGCRPSECLVCAAAGQEDDLREGQVDGVEPR